MCICCINDRPGPFTQVRAELTKAVWERIDAMAGNSYIQNKTTLKTRAKLMKHLAYEVARGDHRPYVRQALLNAVEPEYLTLEPDLPVLLQVARDKNFLRKDLAIEAEIASFKLSPLARFNLSMSLKRYRKGLC